MSDPTPQELRAMAEDKSLDIGTAWNALAEAADEIERLRRIFIRPAKPVGIPLMKKLRNRRVLCRMLSDGSYEFKFRRYVRGYGVSVEGIRLTEEAVCAMFTLVAAVKQSNQQISRDGGMEE